MISKPLLINKTIWIVIDWLWTIWLFYKKYILVNTCKSKMKSGKVFLNSFFSFIRIITHSDHCSLHLKSYGQYIRHYVTSPPFTRCVAIVCLAISGVRGMHCPVGLHSSYEHRKINNNYDLNKKLFINLFTLCPVMP